MERVPSCVRLVFVALLFFWGSAAAQNCSKLYWYDDQRSYCLSCSSGPPPWGTGSYYAYQLRFYVLCQSCGVPCQVFTQGGSCAAALSQGEHLGGALLYGIRSPESSVEFSGIIQSAPELALVLLDRRVSSDGARSSDMKRLESRTGRLISPEFVMLAASGAPIDEGDVERLTSEVADGFEILVEAVTEVSSGGSAILVLNSKLVRVGTHEGVRALNHYVVHLKEVSGEMVGVEGFPLLTAKVYEITGMEDFSTCHDGCMGRVPLER